MDIFQTLATGCSIIYTFIDSYTAASSQSRSLAARLNWDLLVLGQFINHYETISLSPAESEMLASSAAYLASLAVKVSSIAARLESTKRLEREWMKMTWWHRENEVRLLEAELFEWTTRLDLRLVGLPAEMKTLIRLDAKDEQAAPNFIASVSIQSLGHITARARSAATEEIWVDNVPDTMRQQMLAKKDSFHLIQQDGQQLLVEKRTCPATRDSPGWLALKENLMGLANALHCLDGTSVSLLHCRHLCDMMMPVPAEPLFYLVHTLPFAVRGQSSTLKDRITQSQESVSNASVGHSQAKPSTIRMPAAHPLSERFHVAQALATAVFFLHSVGYVHHAVTSLNVILLHPASTPTQCGFPYSLGTPFLVGLEAAKPISTQSDKTGHGPHLLYQHPDRLVDVGIRPKYMERHDIYSLGMILLELALWRPLERWRDQLLNPTVEAACKVTLVEMAATAMGSRYAGIIRWCLECREVNPQRFSREVLEPLEEMNEALR